MTIGERIRKRRKELGLSVQDLARKCGMANSTLYDLENGGMSRTTKLHLLAKALGVSADFLEYGRVNPASVAEARGAYHVREQLSDEEHDFALEWRKLEEPAKTQILTMVESLVAQQIQAARAKKKKSQQVERNGNKPN